VKLESQILHAWHQFLISPLWYGADNPPYVQVGLKANGPGSDDAVRIRVGGEYQSHERYSGFGTVHIKCPQ
jgi:hypothetical protein